MCLDRSEQNNISYSRRSVHDMCENAHENHNIIETSSIGFPIGFVPQTATEYRLVHTKL